MTESKTNMFGKVYNTIGSTDSNFIIKTKGDLKVQWGNKYIDIIKNGKINSESNDILKKEDNIEKVTSDGIYLIEDIIWIVIDGVKVQLLSNSENVFVSYLTELKNITPDLKNRALTNIGFYYDTLDEAKSAKINAGLIYVKGDNKLYVIKDGIFSEYAIYLQDDNKKIEESNFEKLYIEDYSLMVDREKYATLENYYINVHKPLIVNNGIYSKDTHNDSGYKLHILDGESYLEVDHVILRKEIFSITHQKLLDLIEDNALVPSKYYMIKDFQNPWEVSWYDELLNYENKYDEINGVKYLSEIRNATLLIVLADTRNTLKKQVWSLKNPKWYIEYDVNYIGPKHEIPNNPVHDRILYGFRYREEEYKNSENSENIKSTIYLPCKGRITYLKDEFENEGNFNFRQLMFKHTEQGNSFWRYCIDNTNGNSLLGTFEENSSKNKFFIDPLHVDMLIFKVIKNKNDKGDIISYSIIREEGKDDINISKGYQIRLLSKNNIFENTFIINDTNPRDYPLKININSDNLSENNFTEVYNDINIVNTNFTKNTFFKCKKINNIKCEMIGNFLENVLGDMTINKKMSYNTLKNLKKGLTVSIECHYNTINNFQNEKDALLVSGKNFNNNILNTLNNNIINTDTFENNIIDTCNKITNSGTFSNNTINICDSITNSGTFSNNQIESSVGITNTNDSNFKNNTINTCDTITNNGTFNNNQIESLVNVTNNSNFENNTIDACDTITNYGTFSNNIINNISNSNFTCNNFKNNRIYNSFSSDSYYIDTYNTYFHGEIIYPPIEIPQYDIELLNNWDDIKDVYPDFKVVCIPKICIPGMIMMWDNNMGDIPLGWIECDGNNGTPNLIDKFINNKSEEKNKDSEDLTNTKTSSDPEITFIMKI